MQRSYRVVAEGGLDLWEDLKSKSQGTVTITTDDTEITHAVLLRQNHNEVRVGTYCPTRTSDLDTRETGRRYRSQVLSINAARIKTIKTIG